MCRISPLLVCCCSVIWVGSGGCNDTTNPRNAYSSLIIGKWEMVETEELNRKGAQLEVMEFSKDGQFKLIVGGSVERTGSYRIEQDKLILYNTQETPIGDPLTIKRLTANSMTLSTGEGKKTDFARK